MRHVLELLIGGAVLIALLLVAAAVAAHEPLAVTPGEWMSTLLQP